MRIFLSIIGIAASFVLIKYRQRVGDTFGQSDWMRYVGGIYGLVVLIAMFIFLWSISELMGTRNILLAPLRFIIPVPTPPPAPEF